MTVLPTQIARRLELGTGFGCLAKGEDRKREGPRGVNSSPVIYTNFLLIGPLSLVDLSPKIRGTDLSRNEILELSTSFQQFYFKFIFV